ncbi:unnamed protein product [Ixodes persulcatus]
MCLPWLIFFTLRVISTVFSFSWLLVLPVCAIVFGISAFSSLSLAISSALLASQLIPTVIRQWFPFLEMIVVSFVMVFPLMFVPHWVSELHLMLLAFVEPLFLVMEVVQIVSLVRWTNGCAQEGIDNQPTVWKALVISVTLSCWVASVYFMLRLFRMDDTGAVLVSSLFLYFVIIYYVNYAGDVALFSCPSIVACHAFVVLNHGVLNSVVDVLVDLGLEGRRRDGSLLSMLMTLPSISTGALTRTLRGLSSVTGAAFWTGVVLRVSLAVAFLRGFLAGSRVTVPSRAQDDDDEYDRPKLLSSLVPVRVVATALALVAYSQALWRQLDGCDHMVVRSSRSTQAVLLVVAYKAQLLFFGQSS